MQNDLQQHYIDRLQSGEQIDSVITDAVNDKQLYLYGDIHDYLQNVHQSVDIITQLLTINFITATALSMSPVIVRKLRILTILKKFESPQISWDYLKTATLVETDTAIINIVLEMVKDKLVDVRIDEKNRQVNVISLFVIRDLPHGRDLASELDEVITTMKTRLSDAITSLTGTDHVLANFSSIQVTFVNENKQRRIQ